MLSEPILAPKAATEAATVRQRPYLYSLTILFDCLSLCEVQDIASYL